MIILPLTDRELDLIIDSIVHRRDDIFDSLPFTVNVITAKRHHSELNRLLNKLRGKRDEKTTKIN